MENRNIFALRNLLIVPISSPKCIANSLYWAIFHRLPCPIPCHFNVSIKIRKEPCAAPDFSLKLGEGPSPSGESLPSAVPPWQMTIIICKMRPSCYPLRSFCPPPICSTCGLDVAVRLFPHFHFYLGFGLVHCDCCCN